MTTQQMIDDELKAHNGNLSMVARALGLDYHALKMRNNPDFGQVQSAVGPEPLNIKTLGKENFRQYVIAVKKVGTSWPSKYDGIITDARKKFDAGTHEMFQTTKDGWVVQYLIPYLVPTRRRQFFSTMIVMR